ncbi:hypothetical protein [Streptomyces sp. NPDC004726]
MGISRFTTIRHTLCALFIALAVAGCTTRPPPGNSGQPATPAPTPQTTSLTDICVHLISYWAKETLKGGTWSGLDWEQKGLSNEQYDIHEEVVAAARAEEKRRGRDAALALIDARTRQECAVRGGATGSSENWRPPSRAADPAAGTRAST